MNTTSLLFLDATQNANTVLAKIFPYLLVCIALMVVGALIKLTAEYFNKRGAERAKVVDEAWATMVAAIAIGAGFGIILSLAASLFGIHFTIPGVS